MVGKWPYHPTMIETSARIRLKIPPKTSGLKLRIPPETVDPIPYSAITNRYASPHSNPPKAENSRTMRSTTDQVDQR
jgi:hypothetical protein